MPDTRKFESGDAWVEIDIEACTGVSDCVDICPADVYEVEGGKVKADNIGECLECGACEGVCPSDAILNHWAW